MEVDDHGGLCKNNKGRIYLNKVQNFHSSLYVFAPEWDRS